MRLAQEAPELEQIAKAFQAISREISYEGLAKALLKAALAHSGVDRGAVLLSEGGELLDKADVNFAREKTKLFVSNPSTGEFRWPASLSERVLARQETVVRRGRLKASPLINAGNHPPEANISQLWLPLIHQERTIGVLYIESRCKEKFTPRLVSEMSMLASQAAVSFESTQLFEALRETHMWMIKGQQIGRMGSYRWNLRTLFSRASRECYRIFDIDLHINPVPFEVFKERIHPDDFPALQEALEAAVATKSPFSHEYRIVHRDGTTLDVVAVGQFDAGPAGEVELEGIISDITDRKAAEQALQDARNGLARAMGLASLGEFAGSIVHEINQPLTGIIASAEACLHWLARNPARLDEARESAMRVIEQGRRATDVVTGLRSLVRDTQLRFSAVHINNAVEDVLFISKRDIERAGVTLRVDLDRSMPNVEGDLVQLQQIVVNLVRNAIDAMASVHGRARVLTVSSRTIDGRVAVAVADTGVGIDSTSRKLLFDPLYTTKTEGLGLGLSICRKIVAVHGGRIWVTENATYGVTFTFNVPIRQAGQISKSS